MPRPQHKVNCLLCWAYLTSLSIHTHYNFFFDINFFLSVMQRKTSNPNAINALNQKSITPVRTSVQ